MMLTSIPVKDFVDPPINSRPWNAISKAIQRKPEIDFIGEVKGERYYRVCGQGSDARCVRIWRDELSGEKVAKCECEAHYLRTEPTHCYHLGAVLIYEATKERI